MRDVAKLEGRDTALPWIYRVATNYCLNVRRNAGRRGEEPMPELEMAEQESAGGMDGVPDRQTGQQVLSRFEGKTKAIAVAVFVDGMEQEEVAQVLGSSGGTVSRKLDRS